MQLLSKNPTACSYFLLVILDGQNCANNPNISTPGDYFILEGIQFVMPNLTSNCNGGRISGVTANMYAARRFGSLPVFQVWHPLSPGSNVYSKVGQVQFEAPEGANIVTRIHISNVSLTGSDRIEFQSGDVIGCYQPFFSRYTVGANNASYTSYFTNSSSLAATTINVNNVSYFETIMQPLINVMIGECACTTHIHNTNLKLLFLVIYSYTYIYT